MWSYVFSCGTLLTDDDCLIYLFLFIYLFIYLFIESPQKVAKYTLKQQTQDKNKKRGRVWQG